MVFLSQKADGNMIFTDYWKVIVLIFSRMGNTVFIWVKKLMERCYLLVTEKFLFWTFRWWEIAFFSAKMSMERWYLYGRFKLSMIFQDLGNMVFRAVLRRPRVANYVDIIKFAILYISTTLKNSNKVKRIRNYILKWNIYLYFLI